MSIVKLGALVKTPGEYDEQGNQTKSPELYTDPETNVPYYHVDSTELLDGLEGFRVTPEPGHHKFAGIETYHYRFASKDEWDAHDPTPPVEDDEYYEEES